jgi:hypothetical protein
LVYETLFRSRISVIERRLGLAILVPAIYNKKWER